MIQNQSLVFGLILGLCLGEDVPDVNITSGPIKGTAIETSSGKLVYGYLGIPYAKPPIGDLRFKNPQPVEPWAEVFEASKYGTTCMQNPMANVLFSLPGHSILRFDTPEGEDCLNLNVLVPKDRVEASNVMIFIHGGSLKFMSSSSEVSKAHEMVAEANVIFVSMNYRMGPFGFLLLDHLEVNGNQGLMDQVMAIKWVKENIAAFGGDPNKITLAGYSSGALSTGFHLVSPLVKGHFQRAILESGSPLFVEAIFPEAKARNDSSDFTRVLGCSEGETDTTSILKCLQETGTKEINDVLAKNQAMNFYPIVDGTFLTKHPHESYKTGEFEKVDLIIGLNKNEGAAFLAAFDPLKFSFTKDEVGALDEKDLEKLFNQYLRSPPNDTIKELESVYGNETTLSTSIGIAEIAGNFVGDYIFNCGAIKTSNYLATTPGKKIFAFLMAHRTNATEEPKWVGVSHLTNIQYVLGHVLKKDQPFSEEERTLSRRVIHYYANFMRTGDPNVSPDSNPEDWVVWPEYTTTDHRYFEQALKSTHILKNVRETECLLMDRLTVNLTQTD